MKALFVVLGLSAFLATSDAATRYVRAGASGSNNGTDWTNAYTQLTSAETAAARGDVIYVADGAYNAVTFDTAISSTSTITIKKATVADHGTSTGWLDTYGDGQATFATDCFIRTGYWIIDGQVGGGPGSWTSGHGFKFNTIQIRNASGDPNDAIPGGNIEIHHAEFQATLTPGVADAISADSLNGLVVSYCYTHDTDNCPFNLYLTTNFDIHHNWTGEYASSVEFHAEIFFLYGRGNGKIRDNLFRWVESTGGIMINNPDGEPIDVFGNVFYRAIGETWSYGGDGMLGTWSNRADLSCHDVRVYNNTFINIPSDAMAVVGSTPHSGLECKNNLFYNSDTGLPNGAWTADYNHHVSSGSATGSNSTTGTGNPFVDYPNLDFSLTANTTAGQDLGAPYNVDMLGNTRTTWTRGAIEFQSEGGGGGGNTLTITVLQIGGILLPHFTSNAFPK